MNKLSVLAMSTLMLSACASQSEKGETTTANDWSLDRFADIQVLRYEVPGFDQLSLQQKTLVYYLQEAALWGRDILWDQNCKYNLEVRQLLEAVYCNYSGDHEDLNWQAFETYFKQVEFANGLHHHYSTAKFKPEFSQEFLQRQVDALPTSAQKAKDIWTQDDIKKVIFDDTFLPVRVNQADGQDLILTSACNFYEGVTQEEVESFYAKMKKAGDPVHPVMYGLNSQLTKDEHGFLVEKPWTSTGGYSPAISKIVENLRLAMPYAENLQQKTVIAKLIRYYETGNLKDFDDYSIEWVKDLNSKVDFINGFIESYGDPLGLRGSWEAMVNVLDSANTARTHVIASNAQWFEDNSPVDPRFRKPVVKGVTAKVITACILAGDSYPSTPIGINLPNSNWIRAEHGSKSVTIDNITYAYDQAAKGNGFGEEFYVGKEELDRQNKYGYITDNVHTDLHECLGHASGQLLPGTDPDCLKAYGSTLEEGRADLFALYYIADPKLVELGILPDMEAYKSQYYSYMLNGLMTQLVRIKPGDNIEEAHMRNRSFIAHWVYEKGLEEKVCVMDRRNGKTILMVNDYEKLRDLFGQLLAEVQRIKSEGDFEAGRQLVETYGVKVDPELHREILTRYNALNIAPYKGFVNPRYELVKNSKGEIQDVKIQYGEGYVEQMLRYSRDYSPLTH